MYHIQSVGMPLMDERRFDHIHNFLLSKNPSEVLSQLNADQINKLFEKLRQHHEQLMDLARLDPLTQLPNRLYFEMGINRLLAQAKRCQHKVAVMTLDLDGFKEVNDHYGHAVGDLLLKKVAQCLGTVTRQEDLVARIGGDEFVIVLPWINAYTDAGNVALKLIEAVKKVELEGYADLHINCCIGIAEYPIAADCINDLLACSDKALHKAKESGAGSFEYFSLKAKQVHQYSRKLIQTIRQKLVDNNLSLSYLPIYTLPCLGVVGLQVRLPGMQDIFLNFNEEDSFYEELSVKYLKKAHDNFRQWQEQGIDVSNLNLFLAVNEQMLASNFFKNELGTKFEEDAAFKKSCILRVFNINGTLLSETILATYTDMGSVFCFTYNENQQTKPIVLCDYCPHYVDVSLSTIYSQSAPIKKKLDFVMAVVSFLQTLNVKVILSGVEHEEHKHIAMTSSVNGVCGYLFSNYLSHKETVHYLSNLSFV